MHECPKVRSVKKIKSIKDTDLDLAVCVLNVGTVREMSTFFGQALVIGPFEPVFSTQLISVHVFMFMSWAGTRYARQAKVGDL